MLSKLNFAYANIICDIQERLKVNFISLVIFKRLQLLSKQGVLDYLESEVQAIPYLNIINASFLMYEYYEFLIQFFLRKDEIFPPQH